MVGCSRGRSRAWWGLFLCASLAIGCYLAFDVLGLDGSNLHRLLNNVALAPMAAEPDVRHILPRPPTLPDPPDIPRAPFFHEMFFASLRIAPGAVPVIASSRFEGSRPRAQLGREYSASDSSASPADSLA